MRQWLLAWLGVVVAVLSGAGMSRAGPMAAPVAQSASNVELVGQIGGTIMAVAVQGTYAYIGVGSRLVI